MLNVAYKNGYFDFDENSEMTETSMVDVRSKAQTPQANEGGSRNFALVPTKAYQVYYAYCFTLWAST